MEFIISVLLSGIAVGGQYALIAIGYTMVYGILRLINFAHGDVFMVAGLMGIYFAATMPLYIALPLVIIMTVVLGFVIERVAYKPLRTAPRMSVMISAIGVSYLLQNTATYITGGLSGDRRPDKDRYHCGYPHQAGGAHHPHSGDSAGRRPDPAYQPHQGGYGHARRVRGL